MSQAGANNNGGVGPIPTIEFEADDGGIATPNGGGLVNVFSADTTDNHDNGIFTEASGNTIDILLTNRITGFISTNNAAVVTIATFNLGADPAVYNFQGNFIGNDTTDGLGASYSFSACIRTDGATSTEIGVEYSNEFEDPAITAADIFVVADGAGNNVLFQVQGIVAKTFDWSVLAIYRKV